VKAELAPEVVLLDRRDELGQFVHVRVRELGQVRGLRHAQLIQPKLHRSRLPLGQVQRQHPLVHQAHALNTMTCDLLLFVWTLAWEMNGFNNNLKKRRVK